MPLAVKAGSPSHWTTREFPLLCFNKNCHLETAAVYALSGSLLLVWALVLDLLSDRM